MPISRRPIARALAATVLACALVATSQGRQHESRTPRPEARSGQFDYYLLSLSWSPTYCLTHRDDKAECGDKGYGFVLHGLWPQYEAGGYPERCPTAARLDGAAERAGMMVYVSPHLMRHEWQVHGTCSGLEAANYFRSADRALASIHIPPASRRTVTSPGCAGTRNSISPSKPAGSGPASRSASTGCQ